MRVSEKRLRQIIRECLSERYKRNLINVGGILEWSAESGVAATFKHKTATGHGVPRARDYDPRGYGKLIQAPEKTVPGKLGAIKTGAKESKGVVDILRSVTWPKTASDRIHKILSTIEKNQSLSQILDLPENKAVIERALEFGEYLSLIDTLERIAYKR